MARAIELFNGSMTHQAQLARDTALRMRAPAQNRMHFACIAKMNACFIAKFICESPPGAGGINIEGSYKSLVEVLLKF